MVELNFFSDRVIVVFRRIKIFPIFFFCDLLKIGLKIKLVIISFILKIVIQFYHLASSTQ